MIALLILGVVGIGLGLAIGYSIDHIESTLIIITGIACICVFFNLTGYDNGYKDGVNNMIDKKVIISYIINKDSTIIDTLFQYKEEWIKH